MSHLFTPEPVEDRPDRPDQRCTPELLLAWLAELGRSPTLKECEDKFGGVWGCIIDAWELQRRGLMPPGTCRR